MLKRPLNSMFSSAVRNGIKTTTIRKNAWPIGRPIMLFNWKGKPYRSKHVDVAAVLVSEVTEIEITRSNIGMGYWRKGTDDFLDLWVSEGFTYKADMDSWFKQRLKPGEVVSMFLMRFSLIKS